MQVAARQARVLGGGVIMMHPAHYLLPIKEPAIEQLQCLCIGRSVCFHQQFELQSVGCVRTIPPGLLISAATF